MRNALLLRRMHAMPPVLHTPQFSTLVKGGLRSVYVEELLNLHTALAERAVFHMDIRPDHLLCADDHLLLIDWGFAVLPGDDTADNYSGARCVFCCGRLSVGRNVEMGANRPINNFFRVGSFVPACLVVQDAPSSRTSQGTTGSMLQAAQQHSAMQS